MKSGRFSATKVESPLSGAGCVKSLRTPSSSASMVGEKMSVCHLTNNHRTLRLVARALPRQSHHRRAHPRGPHPQGQQPPRHRPAHGRPVIPSIKVLSGRLVPPHPRQARNQGRRHRRRTKLARILYAMVKHRTPFDPDRLGNPGQNRARKERFLRRQAEQLGFTLTPVEGEVS